MPPRISGARRILESSTLMTWGAFVVRAGSFLALLPVVLRELSPAEIVIWYLFASLTAMQTILDLGFGATFTRAVAYAMAGARSLAIVDATSDGRGDGTPDWKLMARIVSTMNAIFRRVSFAALLALGLFGTWALIAPTAALRDGTTTWFAWALVLLASTLKLRSGTYACYLEGTNRVALLRRWDIVFGLGALATGVATLLAGGGLLAVVASFQAWTLAGIARDREFCRRLDDGRFRSLVGAPFDREIVASLWPSAWRCGLGSIMTGGVIYASSLLVAQIGETPLVASYLLSMKLIESVSQFSMAPFYSKLPLLARMRAEGDIVGVVGSARRGMTLSYWTFVCGFLFLGLFADPMLVLLRSNASFATPELWILLGFAFLLQRYGGMHVQLYSTTNHIVSHTAEIVSGIIFGAVAFGLIGRIGVLAIPVGLICGYLGFYCWYVARLSYRAIGTRFAAFERTVLFPPATVFLAYSAWQATAGFM